MSLIDQLQRLHEAATKGEWFATDDGRVTNDDGDTLFHDDSVLVPSENEMAQAAALHNAWPAIHRVLVAARAVDKAPTPAALEIELRNLGHALRALDGKEQRT